MSLSARRFQKAPVRYDPICASKVAYTSAAHAASSIRGVERDIGRNRLESYECWTCGKWHLTKRWRTR